MTAQLALSSFLLLFPQTHTHLMIASIFFSLLFRCYKQTLKMHFIRLKILLPYSLLHTVSQDNLLTVNVSSVWKASPPTTISPAISSADYKRLRLD